MRLSLLLLLASIAAAEGPALDEPTMRRLGEALADVNLSIDDLGWDKRPLNDDFRLSCVNETLDHPLALADRALRAEREFAGDPAASGRAAAAWLDIPAPSPVAAPESALDRPDKFPDDFFAVVHSLYRSWQAAEALREAAFAPLSDEEREVVKKHGPRLYVDDSEEDNAAGLLAAAKKIDIAKLLQAEIVLADASALARTWMSNLAGKPFESTRFEQDGVAIEVGGPGADAHTATIVIDTGGNDACTGCSWVVDLGGDDTYRDCGGGLLACGLVVDLAGNDRYLGGDFTEGGACFGASLLVDVAGDDRYEAGQCSQGAGVFGIGMLFDLAGRDAYRGDRFVQGFGGVRGLGALSDVEGNDTYYAGGKFSHAPLLPENFQSLSQGFGFGLRGANTSGGVGVLCDHAGNDIYSAEVFGQGASYWFSLGVLVDSAGHDKYDLYQYGQGAGIHLSAGVLFDRAGNDAYSCNNGVAQGCGHDWASGMLWDLAGDDYYQGSGMTQGGANANGIGILIDRAGADAYSGNHPEVEGWSFASRDTIGLGLMLDLGGKDKYTSGGADDSVWTKSSVGVGLDCEEAVK